MRNCILSVVHAVLVHNLLRLKRDKHRKALGRERAKSVDLANANGKHRIQSIRLLEGQRCHLAHVLASCGKNRFGISIEHRRTREIFSTLNDTVTNRFDFIK